ncbi:uncharacterized protein [Elaeis guineensis]|uniref:uncharacterized protein isoform X1 n=1 Tax=Elaeis guineensis var. tenera TaxID=51953 RepID=UPI003C6D87E7
MGTVEITVLLSGPGSASLALHQGYCLHNGCCTIQNVFASSNGCKFKYQSLIHTHFHQDLVFLPDINILDSFAYEDQGLIPTYQHLKRFPLSTYSVPVSMLNAAWLNSKSSHHGVGSSQCSA